jgi:hypothetical protein
MFNRSYMLAESLVIKKCNNGIVQNDDSANQRKTYPHSKRNKKP